MITDFPLGHEPLTIVTGDRRNPRAANATIGDYFALSPSSGDFAFLTELGLHDAPIDTDKAWVWRDEDYLRAEYGDRHLLVIGSPATNFAARYLNPYAVFQFSLSDSWMAWWRRFLLEHSLVTDDLGFMVFEAFLRQRLMGEAFDAKDVVNDFPASDMEQIAALVDALPLDAEEMHDSSEWAVRSIADHFRPPSFVDIVDGTLRGDVTRPQNDFALISVAPNPFSQDDHVAVLVGGKHVVGTMHALRLLGIPEFFVDHPLGGVIEVTMSKYADEPGRFRQAKSHWTTSPYTFDDVRGRLVQCAEENYEADSALAAADLTHLDELMKFVDRAATTAAG